MGSRAADRVAASAIVWILCKYVTVNSLLGTKKVIDGSVGCLNVAQDTKSKALELALSQIEKQYGKGSIMKLGEEAISTDIPVISTGSFGLDIALGVGGLPRGRVVEIYGPESSGKTTLALECIAEAQKAGGIGAFIDAEHALDAGYARKLGVKVEDLLISQPDNGEQALEIAETLVQSSAIDVLVIDSVAALVPRAEIEGEMGEPQMGLQARLMSQALRKLTSIIARSRTIVIFINQIRMKIGVMFGNPETTTGGNALKFYSSVRIDIRRIGAIKSGNDVVGSRTKVKVVKNKVAPPFKEAEFDILYGTGISKEGELVDLAAEHNIVEKLGAWYSYKGERIGQGRENARETLRNNPPMADDIEAQVREKLMVHKLPAETTPERGTGFQPVIFFEHRPGLDGLSNLARRGRNQPRLSARLIRWAKMNAYAVDH